LFLKELVSHGHKATLIPVLSFKFVSLNTLSDKVISVVTINELICVLHLHIYSFSFLFFFFFQLFQPEKHSGLIFTSPRAVEAVKMCLEAEERKEGERIYIEEIRNISWNKNMFNVLSGLCIAFLNIQFETWNYVQHSILIPSEWNKSAKDKWNTKSIYVVGKATAALGELSHLSTHFSF